MPGLEQKQIDHLNAMMSDRWARELREIRSLFSGEGEERQQVTLGASVDEASDEALIARLATVDDPLIRQNLQDVRDIAYERLLAYPTAKRCIGCQREREKRKAGV